MTRPTLAITGASGGIGRLLVDRALRDGYRVIALSRRPMTRPEPGFEWRPFDLGEAPEPMVARLAGAQAVVHLAVCIVGEDPEPELCEEVWKVNVLGTRRVVMAAAKAGVQHMVAASTANFYSADLSEASETSLVDPTSRTLYLGSKAVQDSTVRSLCQTLVLPCAVMRISSVIGLDQNIVDTFARRLVEGRDVTVSDSFGADFVSADDVVAGLLLAVEGRHQGIYNLSSGRRTLLVDVARRIAALAGRGQDAVDVQARAAQADRGFPAINCDRLRALGYAPTALDTVLSDMVERARADAPVRQASIAG